MIFFFRLTATTFPFFLACNVLLLDWISSDRLATGRWESYSDIGSGFVFRTVTLQARSDPLVSKPLTAEGRSPPFSAVYWLGSDSFPCFLVCLGNPVTRAILSFTNATRPNLRNLDLAAGNKSAICLTNFFVCSYSDPINREWMPGKVSMPLAFWLKRENGVNLKQEFLSSEGSLNQFSLRICHHPWSSWFDRGRPG